MKEYNKSSLLQGTIQVQKPIICINGQHDFSIITLFFTHTNADVKSLLSEQFTGANIVDNLLRHLSIRVE